MNTIDCIKTRRSVRKFKAETFDGFEGILFYATPDMLSGLSGWAFTIQMPMMPSLPSSVLVAAQLFR